MKKTILVVSTFLLFAGLTFGQTPQTQDKSKTTTNTTKTETKATPAKGDPKHEGCEKSCTMKKSSCCDHKGEMKKEEKAPEKK